jgi:multiple sugar transport system permease protein
VRRVLGIAIGAAAIAAAVLLPLALMLKQAVTPDAESFAWPPTWLPQQPTLANFRDLLGSAELPYAAWLSGLVGGLTVLSTLALTVSAAWAAARTPRVGRGLDAILVIVRVFPSLALAIPMAVLFVHVGLYNNPAGLGLWVAHTMVALPFAFFILRNGFLRIPVELEEAAQLDGATPFRAVMRITLPLASPALAAAALLVFLVSWDEFAYALMLQVTNRPLPPLLYYFAAFGYPGMACAVAAVMVVPAILIIAALAPAVRGGALSGSGR